MATFKPGVTVLRGKQSLEQVSQMLNLLSANEVLVGFPDDGSTRQGEDGKDSPITNAALGYIHDNGMPEQNIPQREFMRPGIKDAEDKITRRLAQTATAVVQRGGDATVVEQGLLAVGLIAQLAIQNKIRDGIPPPLAKSTLLARARKRPNRIGPGLELLSRDKGHEPSMDFVTPLIDSGEMLKHVTYVIRSRKKRKK